MKKLVYIPFIAALLIVSACHREWTNPNETMPSAEADITSILVNPHVFDSAGVKVRGMVWDKERIQPDPKEGEDGELILPEPYVYFKISDRKGYYLGVVADESHSFEDGDIVEVVGLYRKDYISDRRHFKNEIDARYINVIESLEQKYGKE